MNKNICRAIKNNGSRCTTATNTEKYLYQNKDIYLCKIHVKVLINNKLKICEDKKVNNFINQKIEMLNNDMQSLNIKDNIYDIFCGKVNINNLSKALKLYKHILITGSTGIGKTLSIDLIFSKKIYDIIYYEDEKLSHFIKNNNNKSVKNKKKVIVVDNIEELDIKEINQILKSNILSKNSFIIFICNDEYINHKDLKTIKSYFYNFKFTTPSRDEIFIFIKNMCSKNKVNITDNKINELRSIINEI
jgi:hypothetical protein